MPFPYPYSYSELDERVNAPDEDWDAYMRRLRSISALKYVVPATVQLSILFERNVHSALGTSSNKAHTPSGEVFIPIDSGLRYATQDALLHNAL